MAIEVKCPVCGHEFRRPDGLVGKLEKCPECREVIRMPSVASLPDRQQASFQPPPRPAPLPAATVEESGNPYQSPATDTWSESRGRRMPQAKRHGLLTAWLILMIIVNALGAIVCLLRSVWWARLITHTVNWFLPLMLVATLINVGGLVCAIALLRWKKWGFYGYLVLKVIDIVGGVLLGNVSAAFGVIGIAILFGLLHIGGPDKAWYNLE
jgi:hypothetical protein